MSRHTEYLEVSMIDILSGGNTAARDWCGEIRCIAPELNGILALLCPHPPCHASLTISEFSQSLHPNVCVHDPIKRLFAQKDETNQG
jgi:hypothetical protein